MTPLRGQTRISGLNVATADGAEVVTADAYVCACDVPGIKRLIPEAWRQWPEFDNIFKLDAVPVATVQLRFDGWGDGTPRSQGSPRPQSRCGSG